MTDKLQGISPGDRVRAAMPEHALILEYRRSMDKDTLHDWAVDAVEYMRRQAARAEQMKAALKPFALYIDVLETMGGNTPRSGTYCSVTSSVMGEAEITVEDMQSARIAMDLS